MVKNWKVEFNQKGANVIRFYYHGDIKLKTRKIIKENFILIESNIEIVFLNYLSKILNLD